MHTLMPHHNLTTYTKAVVIILVLVFGIVCALYVWIHRDSIFSAPTAASQQTNLLQSGWDHLSGVTPQVDGLHITYTDHAIVQQDGTAGMTSPAVNLYGTHLYTNGDYTLTARISDLKGSSILRLYSAAPLTQDEFYTNHKSLELIINDASVTLNTWDSNQSKNPYVQKPRSSVTRKINQSSVHTLSLTRANDQLTIQIDNTQIAQQKYRTTFNSEVWFGLTAKNNGDSWTLQSLDLNTSTPNRVYPVNTQTMTPPPRLPATGALQTLATQKRADFQIGAAVALAPSVSDNNYRKLVYEGHFGSITTENVLKWQFIHPQPGVYDFTDADNLIDLARHYGLTVHGHTLIFGEANPAWVQDLATVSAAERDNVKQIMIDHIAQTVQHFKGRIGSWDVVNEPLNDDEDVINLRHHKWFDAMGESYIATAFETAHQVDPQAKLFINDFGLEADGDRWNTMLALVTKLTAAGVPIDGVGFQAHVYEEADKIDTAILRQHIRQLAALGLISRISEMDVYSDDGPEVQAQQYRDVFAVCFDEPSCVSWTTWGVSDRYNLYLDDNGRIVNGQDYLWDANAQPTPAFQHIETFLQQ
jgi:endo-1,4-beta-xylanase